MKNHSPGFRLLLWCASLLALASFSVQAVDIVEVSIKTNSQNFLSRPAVDDVWKISTPPYPFDIYRGIGFIVRPIIVGDNDYRDFALHQNDNIQVTAAYISPYVPNPTNATVTFKFDLPSAVGGVELVQHVSGATRVEGLLGDSVPALTSIGSVFGPAGDITDAPVSGEAESQIFRFTNTNLTGTTFQMVIRKTAQSSAFALYRAFPLDLNGNRIPLAVQAPILLSIKLSQVAISWNSIPGKMYQVQFFTATNFNQWSNLSSTITATSTNTSTTDSISNRTNRVYRVLQLP
jgi:hypothetical protein